jgi:uncharacterized membrane protein
LSANGMEKSLESDKKSKERNSSLLVILVVGTISLLFLWLAIDTFMDGYHSSRRRVSTKEEDPILFYLWVGVYLFVSGFGFKELYKMIVKKGQNANT